MTSKSRVIRFDVFTGNGHVRPQSPTMSLNFEARLRVSQVLGYLNVSHSTFYAGMKNNRYPKPDGYDGKMPYWHSATIKHFIFE